MDRTQWEDVDGYIAARLAQDDPALAAARRDADAAGLPSIEVSAPFGKLLHLLVRLAGARRILEIGTLGGYSTIWLARALPPDGRMVSLEYEPRHAEVARASIARAGLGGVVEVRVGAALDSLPGVEADGIGPFDLVFIDADKSNNARYVDWAVRLGRPGTVIICDNVVRGGAILDPARTDPGTVGTRALYDTLASHPRLTATALQTVGVKGWDGFALAVVG